MDDNEFCPECGRFVESLDSVTGFCGDCSPQVKDNITTYLTVNADEIEFYLLQGKTLNQAIDSLHLNGRAKCLVCGNTIRRAKKNAIFCRQNVECRKVSRRYVYRYSELKMTKTEALASILKELT